MEVEQQALSDPQPAPGPGFVEMPASTAAPLVLASGVVLLAAGIVVGIAMSIVGAVLLFVGLGLWVGSLLPGRGHFHETRVERDQRAEPIAGTGGMVERLATGMPGYRVQLPQKVHPISAGVKGGLCGGLVLPLPALIYGIVRGYGIWYPVNLLAGVVLPGIDKLSVVELEGFNLSYLIAAVFIHAAMSLTAGLLYGVLMPMLPSIPKPYAWGGLLMPVFWTAVTFLVLLTVNRALARGIDWPSFIFSQFVFGIVAAVVVVRTRRVNRLTAGILAGVIGGLLMIVPAALWGWFTGHGIWYPANVLAGMAVPRIGELPPAVLQQFHADWIGYAVLIHAMMSIVFGVVYSFLLPRLPEIPGPMAWGALLMPVLWTGASYSLMDVVNPVLKQRIDWPWFVVSQFIFGVVASIVVVRSEQIVVPPVGHGPLPT